MHISINMAMTLDGHTALPSGEWRNLSSSKDRSRMDLIRSRHQALLVGKRTFEKDHPRLHLKTEGASPLPFVLCRSSLPEELNQKYPEQKLPVTFIVSRPMQMGVDQRAELPDISCFLQYDNLQYLEGLVSEQSRIDASKSDRADPPSVLWLLSTDDLHPRGIVAGMEAIGIERLLLEGGPSVNRMFLEVDLVDQIYLTLVPFLTGGSAPGIVSHGRAIPGFLQQRWRLQNVETADNETFLVYDRARDL